jgi:hypothetical protein
MRLRGIFTLLRICHDASVWRFWLAAVAATALLVITYSSEARADKRVALVVGNSAYKNVSVLPNPVNDATAIATMLKSVGFEVELRRDLGINDMRRVLRDFSDRTRDADMAVMYFAGHGIEVDGNNYLIPVDAVLERDVDVEDETVSLERITHILEPARRLRLVILDACRENPFQKTMKRTIASRSVGQGLAKVEPTTSDTLIAFAAKAGSFAMDGGGANSPFTTALLKFLPEPGLDLRIAFGRIRDDVLASTQRRQEPYVYGSLGGDTVALVSTKSEPVISVRPAVITEQTPPPAPAADAAVEVAFWNSIRNEKNPQLFEAYLKRYPNGAFADIAKITLEGLRKTALATPEQADDKIAISDTSLLREVHERLYELNFDPGPFDDPDSAAAHQAIREFEQQNHLPQTGLATMGLLRRLRAIGGLKPWGAIVYAPSEEKWGMSWGASSRKDAVARARASCASAKCSAEVSFFGTDCGAFSHSSGVWAIAARDSSQHAKEAALADCRKRGKSCQVVAAVCADGAEQKASAD